MEKLNELIENYGVAKEREKLLKTDIDTWNKEIKDILRDTEDGVGSSDSFEAKFQVVKSESFDEPKLVTMFLTSDFGIPINSEYNIVEYVPRINAEALEKAIYDGRIDPAVLSTYKKVSSVERLTVKRKKETKTFKKRGTA